MSIKIFRRYEKKYIISETQKNKLIMMLNSFLVKDSYCLNGNSYLVRNIYLDTKENILIHNSINKPKYKEKIRIRKYQGQIGYFLEIKKKYKGEVNKRRITISDDEYKHLFNALITKTNTYIENQISKELNYFFQVYPDLECRVFISYLREAYFAKDNHEFRITFDSQIRTRRDNFDFENESYQRQLLKDDQYIMEVKVQGSLPLWFVRALSIYKIYPYSFSKYGTEFKKEILEGEKQYV